MEVLYWIILKFIGPTIKLRYDTFWPLIHVVHSCQLASICSVITSHFFPFIFNHNRTSPSMLFNRQKEIKFLKYYLKKKKKSRKYEAALKVWLTLLNITIGYPFADFVLMPVTQFGIFFLGGVGRGDADGDGDQTSYHYNWKQPEFV